MNVILPNMDSLYNFAYHYHRFICESLKNGDLYARASKIKDLLDNVDPHYRKILIPKKNKNEMRTVFSVSPELRSIQQFIKKRILDPLDDAYTSPYAFAYRRGLSARDNAQEHAGCRYMLKLDIHHFFESIRQGMVYAMLKKYTSYNGKILGTLTRLVCYKGALCQGACTSPQIANLVLSDFDMLIAIYCNNSGIGYTRYCDDLTFSSREPFDSEMLIRTVRLLLMPYHFELNDKKTRVLGPGSRREVTGAVVNDRVRANRDYRQKIRQELYYAEKFGVAEHLEKTRPSWYTSPCTKTQIRHFLFSLRGRISYVTMLYPDDPFLKETLEQYGRLLNKESRAFTSTSIRGLIPLLGSEEYPMSRDLIDQVTRNAYPPDDETPPISIFNDLLCDSIFEPLPDDHSAEFPFDVFGFDDS